MSRACAKAFKIRIFFATIGRLFATKKNNEWSSISFLWKWRQKTVKRRVATDTVGVTYNVRVVHDCTPNWNKRLLYSFSIFYRSSRIPAGRELCWPSRLRASKKGPKFLMKTEVIFTVANKCCRKCVTAVYSKMSASNFIPDKNVLNTWCLHLCGKINLIGKKYISTSMHMRMSYCYVIEYVTNFEKILSW